MISDHATEWLGFPVQLFCAENAEEGISDYANKIYRLATDWDAEIGIDGLMERFTSNPNCAQTPAIIIGAYHGEDSEASSEGVVQLLVAARHQLPNLKAIFLGDIIGEENEISWIQQSDVSAIFSAYPQLEHFRVRGSNSLSFGGGIQLPSLKSLIVESGGLDRQILLDILASDLPNLEHLEIWLGSDNYGANITLADLAPVLEGSRWPRLKRLGLRDSENTNQLAAALRGAPILSQLEELDLSLGVLSDEGADELLSNPDLAHLKLLDLHHHYLSNEMMAKVSSILPQVNLEGAEGDADADDRYIAVSE